MISSTVRCCSALRAVCSCCCSNDARDATVVTEVKLCDSLRLFSASHRECDVFFTMVQHDAMVMLLTGTKWLKLVACVN